MNFGLCKLVATVALFCVIAPAAMAEPDLLTPKKSGVAFAKAVQTGDMATAKSISTGTDAEYAMIQLISDKATSMNGLGAASEKKFGAEGKLPKEMAMDMAGEFESAEEKITGDTATLVLKSKPDDKFPPTFKKDGDKWKIDLSNLGKDPETAQMQQMVPTMIKAMKAVTKNIEDGKYKTAAEAMADLGAQMAGGAAPAPTEPPK